VASTDSRPVPRRGVAFRAYFDLRLNTGALNSGAAGLDAEVSIDGATFVNCANAPVEIAASSGHYALDMTSGELTSDCSIFQIKSSTPNAVTRTIVIYPQDTGDIRVDVDSLKGSSAAAQAQADLATSALSGTVDTSTFSATTTDFETSITKNVANHYVGRSLIFTSGALQDQARRITGYSFTGNNKGKFTVDGTTSAPANGVTFRIA
jgi:hypothetical protein